MKLRFACDEDWDAMPGDDRRRRCARCDHDVHDLSAMTGDEAKALLDAAEGRKLCVRYAADDAGEVIHQPRATRPTDRLLAWAAVAAVPLLAVGIGASQGPSRGAAGTSLGASEGFGDLGGAPGSALAIDGRGADRLAGMQAAIDDALATVDQARSPTVALNPLPPVEPHPPLLPGPEPRPIRKLMGRIARPRLVMGQAPVRDMLMGDVDVGPHTR